jgi:hypothetical protein
MVGRALVVASARAVSGPAAAGDQPYLRQVQTDIELAHTGLAPTGPKLELVLTGSLARGGADWAFLPLEPGRDCRVGGRCDHDPGPDVFLRGC